MSDTPSLVLIVDDNENNRDVLERRITRYGHVVKTAGNGQEALELIYQHSFDLVLLDIMMPEMNGYQVLERVKQDPDFRNIPIIVISAIDDVESIVRCIKLGAEDYLPKPFNPSILKARISASIEKKRLRDREEAHLEDQTISQRVARELNARLSFQRAAEVTLEWAMRRTTAHAGLVGQLLDDGDGMMVLKTAGHDATLAYYEGLELPFEAESLRRAVKMIMPQFSQEKDEDYLLPTSQSRLVMPIGRGGQVLALLLLEGETIEKHSNRTLAFLTRLCDRAANAMFNALLYEQVQRANLAKTEFISEVSHELKNPMTSIRNYAKMLRAAGEVNSAQERFIDTIINNVDRMSNLVSDLSDISRIEVGQMRLELAALQLGEIVAEVISAFEGQIKEKNQALTIELADDLPSVLADRVRLIQILTNLLSNAHKYTPAGGEISLRAKHKPDERGTQRLLQIEVQDNGVGLSERDKEMVFTKYFRAADGRAAGTPGTGLGLRITKQLVELQGGQIWFSSTHNEGSTFYFTLPIAAVQEDELERLELKRKEWEEQK